MPTTSVRIDLVVDNVALPYLVAIRGSRTNNEFVRDLLRAEALRHLQNSLHDQYVAGSAQAESDVLRYINA